MARLGRYFVPDQPQHLIQRGNNRGTVFFSLDDRVQYLDWLREAADEFGCRIHAYVLMTNHVHLLATPERADSLSRMMQTLGRRYVRYVNTGLRRTGTLWEGRYRAAPIDSESYFLACCRYIELNPVRARMVEHPRLYKWSSYRAHAEGANNPLVSDHPLYRALGRNQAARVKAYRALFREVVADDVVAALRGATQGGWALGDEHFAQAIAKASGRRAAPLPVGRKPKRWRKDGRQLQLL
jgi:putative transposase